MLAVTTHTARSGAPLTGGNKPNGDAFLSLNALVAVVRTVRSGRSFCFFVHLRHVKENFKRGGSGRILARARDAKKPRG